MAKPELGPGDILYCRSFKRIGQSFHLTARFCPAAPSCEKRLKFCRILDDLRAECLGAKLGTEEDVSQELALQKLEAEAAPKVNPQGAQIPRQGS